MEKNGFTLVELMVVVIVIGILAAVSMPKFQSAADKTKVAEVQHILNSITGAEERYKHANGEYLLLPASSLYSHNDPLCIDPICIEWKKVGLQVPESKYFNYEVPDTSVGSIDDNNPLNDVAPKFTAKATLMKSLTRANKDDWITIDQTGDKKTNNPALRSLVPSFFK